MINITFIILSLVDYFLTIAILGRTGADMEVNPIAVYVYKDYGLWGLLWFKLLMVGIVIFLIFLIGREKPRMAMALSYFWLVVLGVVVSIGVYTNVCLG